MLRNIEKWKCIIFIIILVLLIISLNLVLKPYKYGYKEYHSLHSNTVDILLTGSSRIFTGIDTMRLWEDSGYSAFILGGNAQPYAASYLSVLEALQTQSPKLLVLDGSVIGMRTTWNDCILAEGTFYDNFDRIPFSLEKGKTVFDLLPVSTASKYFVPLINCHDRWKSVTGENFKLEDANNKKYMGFKGIKLDFSKETQDSETWIDSITPLSEKDLKYFNKNVELAKKAGMQVIVIVTPMLYYQPLFMEDYQQRINALGAYCNDIGITFLNYNLILKDFDYTNNMSDKIHCNYNGAQEVTGHLSKFINENYKIENHLQDKQYDQWNKCMNEYIKELKELSCKPF